MYSSVRGIAPAKVNIGLNVLEKTSAFVGGTADTEYHKIESIFQTVGLSDELSVELLQKSGDCLVHCDLFDLPRENTITKMYNAFCELTGFSAGVHVDIKKRIPAGGGLGGGSSDAATFAVILSELSGVELTQSLADKLSSCVGSDVFFFLSSAVQMKKKKSQSDFLSGCALVSGRGEIVQHIEKRHGLCFVLLFPDVHSSTKEAYVLVDEAYRNNDFVVCPNFAEYENIYRSPVEDWTFANTFTPVLVKKYPVIGEAIADIRKCGASWADMSGSGAVVFGVFKEETSAKLAVATLQKKWAHCVYVH